MLLLDRMAPPAGGGGNRQNTGPTTLTPPQGLAKPGGAKRTYRHVGFAACIQCFGHRVHQVAADAEIAHFHLAQGVDQNIGGLHIWGRKHTHERVRKVPRSPSSGAPMRVTSVYDRQVTVEMF